MEEDEEEEEGGRGIKKWDVTRVPSTRPAQKHVRFSRGPAARGAVVELRMSKS